MSFARSRLTALGSLSLLESMRISFSFSFPSTSLILHYTLRFFGVGESLSIFFIHLTALLAVQPDPAFTTRDWTFKSFLILSIFEV